MPVTDPVFNGFSEIVGDLFSWKRIGYKYAGPFELWNGREAGPAIRQTEWPNGLEWNCTRQRDPVMARDKEYHTKFSMSRSNSSWLIFSVKDSSVHNSAPPP